MIATKRAYPLRYHPVQNAFYHSAVRFNVSPAGRRSGKTEIAKRRMIRRAASFTAYPNGRFVIAAPTGPQVKRIYWDDMKQLSPKRLLFGGSYRSAVRESELSIRYVNGAKVILMGMDRPERVEGDPVDWILLDEYGNMKKHVWTNHVRAALSTPGRLGGADFIGVPEGMNHYYNIWKRACSHLDNWAGYHWFSEDILDPEEIAQAKEELDDETYRQEYRGEFVSSTGRAYYPFTRELHASERLPYEANSPLILCFDFNVSPGVAAICQEQDYTGRNRHVADEFTAVIGEVWIPRHSNTRRVCERIIEDWGDHSGLVFLYGDATGGEGRGAGGGRHTAAEASDWTIIKEILGRRFGNRLKDRVKKGNPRQRARVNAVNSRIRSTSGTIRLLVDPKRAPHVADDFEGVSWLEGGAGELDKDNDPEKTHISDAIGYYIEAKFPVGGGVLTAVDDIE